MNLIGGSDKVPQHLPIGSLKGFGCNPYDEAMWRVVWSESRYYLVGANHVTHDGDPINDKELKVKGKDNIFKEEMGYKWLPLYPGKPGWVLEMWKSPFQFTGCTPEQYEIAYRDPTSGILTLGPYPNRGEYTMSLQFPLTPGFDQVALQINKIRAGWSYTYNDHVNANKQQLEAKEKEKVRIFKDIFKDAQQAFNNNPSSVRPGKRTKDKINFNRRVRNPQIGFQTGGAAPIPQTGK